MGYKQQNREVASADSLRISDEARSPEGAMAKMLLSGKGWLIVS